MEERDILDIFRKDKKYTNNKSDDWILFMFRHRDKWLLNNW